MYYEWYVPSGIVPLVLLAVFDGVLRIIEAQQWLLPYYLLMIRQGVFCVEGGRYQVADWLHSGGGGGGGGRVALSGNRRYVCTRHPLERGWASMVR